MRAGILVGAVAAAAGLVACAPEPEVSGRADFAALCAACHGADARGGGAVANGAPPDLTRIAARDGGSFDYARVMSRIDGYARGGHGTGMPEFGALLEGDTVLVDLGDGVLTPTPERLFGIAQYLASIQRVEG
jgi:mono/diheme cytochrome c family protein